MKDIELLKDPDSTQPPGSKCACCGGEPALVPHRYAPSGLMAVCDCGYYWIVGQPDLVEDNPILEGWSGKSGVELSILAEACGLNAIFNGAYDPACECGAAKCGDHQHSAWCPLA